MNKTKSDIQTLFNTVVNGGYCIGCGACASLNNSSIEIKFDNFLMLQATLTQNPCESNKMEGSVLSVCPFSSQSKNEDEIGKELFGKKSKHSNRLGFVYSTFAGFVKEQDYRKEGSSGGMGTWILTELLKQGLIDYVVHIHEAKPSNEDPRLFKYQISNSIEEIKKGAKSRYYPIELSEVIREIKSKDGKYAIVGLPCFIKAIRLLMSQDHILSDRLKFCVGLVCGHLKSAHFASMWAWQVGIHPSDLKRIDFRTKLKGFRANQYGITAYAEINGEEVIRYSAPLEYLFGANWGWGLFKYKACDYCDDVVAETADVTIGDAWLPLYIEDGAGTNILIVRNKTIDEILRKAQENNQIKLDKLSKDEIIASQSSGFSHRREGLSYRLYLADKEKIWHPKKRVEISDRTIKEKIKKRQKLRAQLMEQSHILFQKALKNNSFQIFKDELTPLLRDYQKLYKKSFIKRAIRKITKFLDL